MQEDFIIIVIRAGKSDNSDDLVVYDSKGFAASFIDGEWMNGIRFSAYELMENVTRIKDPAEIRRIYEEAKSHLC